MVPNKSNRLFLFIILGIVFAYILVYVPTPYYIISPGSAEEIKPMVHYNEGPTEERGAIMLTTVRMTYSNALTYVMAHFNSNSEILKKSDLLQKGESQQEYSERQVYVMQESQSNAIISAYEKAGVPYETVNQGVLVLQTLDGMPAAAILKAGDQILKIDQKVITRREELLEYLKPMTLDSIVKLTYKRDGIERTADIPLAYLPQTEKQSPNTKAAVKRAGLGIVPVDMQKIQAKDPNKQIEIKAGEIGGPSAGLMFALEIYNQLVDADITKGYKIAGTGTINTKGQVGVIGGIQYKVVAADRVGADIFFAPKDFVPPDKRYQPIRNTTEAMRQAKKINTKMKVVSVDTLDDALRYLAALPPKS